MAIQNVIGDSFSGATWVFIHNGGGVAGEVINGGFGMVLDGLKEASRRLQSMLSGMLTMVFQEEVGLVTKSFICNKRAMEAELTSHHPSNIVVDNLLDF
jgi:urocanate hydratase